MRVYFYELYVYTLSVLTEVAERSVLSQNHDAIQEAFEVAYAELGMNVPGNLLSHIAEEKARCVAEATAHEEGCCCNSCNLAHAPEWEMAEEASGRQAD